MSKESKWGGEVARRSQCRAALNDFFYHNNKLSASRQIKARRATEVEWDRQNETTKVKQHNEHVEEVRRSPTEPNHSLDLLHDSFNSLTKDGTAAPKKKVIKVERWTITSGFANKNKTLNKKNPQTKFLNNLKGIAFYAFTASLMRQGKILLEVLHSRENFIFPLWISLIMHAIPWKN